MILSDISDDDETDEDDLGIEFTSISGNHTGDTILQLHLQQQLLLH